MNKKYTIKHALLPALFLFFSLVLAVKFIVAFVPKVYENNRIYDFNFLTNIRLSLQEIIQPNLFNSQTGQDKWILHDVYPKKKNGFFIDLGSADGTYLSNTKSLEHRGWKGVCIDPFPRNMSDRKCQLVKAVVSDKEGENVSFKQAGDLGGMQKTLNAWAENIKIKKAKSITLKTTTLAKILENTKSPNNIEYLSIDIEGAEFLALKNFPFSKYKIGAITIEHNFETIKRQQLYKLLNANGFRLVRSVLQDDWYINTANLKLIKQASRQQKGQAQR